MDNSANGLETPVVKFRMSAVQEVKVCLVHIPHM